MEANHTQLRFGFGESPPQLVDGDISDHIYATLDTTFMKRDFAFHIIGESHYIHTDDASFHEISSCSPIESEDVFTLRLDNPTHATLGFGSGELVCETEIRCYPIDEFDREQSYDLSYRFAEDAYTTIELFDAAYETWHTYPEHNLALFTRSSFIERAVSQND